MSKELEALEKIKNSFGCDLAYYSLNIEYEIVKQALERLEAIDNANPNEALECLEEVYDKIRLSQYLGVVESAKLNTNYNTIKQALTKKSKKEQAWEILKDIVNDDYMYCNIFENNITLDGTVYNLSNEKIKLLKEVEEDD